MRGIVAFKLQCNLLPHAHTTLPRIFCAPANPFARSNPGLEPRSFWSSVSANSAVLTCPWSRGEGRLDRCLLEVPSFELIVTIPSMRAPSPDHRFQRKMLLFSRQWYEGMRTELIQHEEQDPGAFAAGSTPTEGAENAGSVRRVNQVRFWRAALRDLVPWCPSAERVTAMQTRHPIFSLLRRLLCRKLCGTVNRTFEVPSPAAILRNATGWKG